MLALVGARSKERLFTLVETHIAGAKKKGDGHGGDGDDDDDDDVDADADDDNTD